MDDRLEPSGRLLRFGDGAAVLEAIDALVAGGARLGELLALGSRRAAEQIGGKAPDSRPMSRAWSSRATIRVHCTRWHWAWPWGREGPITTAPGPTKPTFPSGPTGGTAGRTRHALAIETEDRAAVMDSLILCKFLRGVFTDFHAEAAQMIAAVTDGR